MFIMKVLKYYLNLNWYEIVIPAHIILYIFKYQGATWYSNQLLTLNKSPPGIIG